MEIRTNNVPKQDLKDPIASSNHAVNCRSHERRYPDISRTWRTYPVDLWTRNAGDQAD
jgi:hypothetical protein